MYNNTMPNPKVRDIESCDIASMCFFLHEQDKHLGKVINKIGPCILQPQPHHFEYLVGTMISQQLSMKAADSIFLRLRSLFVSSRLTPCDFLSKPREVILRTGVSRRKYSYITDLSDKIMHGEIDLHKVHTMHNDQIRVDLKSVKGIGDWTVDMFLMFALARLDVFPIGDLALRKTISSLYNIGVDNKARIIAISNRWKPFQSIACWYLYKYGNSFRHEVQ